MTMKKMESQYDFWTFYIKLFFIWFTSTHMTQFFLSTNMFSPAPEIAGGKQVDQIWSPLFITYLLLINHVLIIKHESNMIWFVWSTCVHTRKLIINTWLINK